MGFNNNLTKNWLIEAKNIISNPKSWLILGMVLAISIFYYMIIPKFYDRLDFLRSIINFEYKYDLNGILVYIPIVFSAIFLGWIGIFTSWILIMIIILPRVVDFTPDVPSLVNNVLALTAPVILLMFVIFLFNWIKMQKRIFEEREIERQSYMSQVLKAHEDERKHIARELHDDAIQTLIALANRMQSLLNKEANKLSEPAVQQLEQFRDSVFDLSKDLRRLSVELRSSILDEIGLVEALRWLVEGLNENSIEAKLSINGEVRTFTPDTDILVFRFVQEALNNVRRHAEATVVAVNIDFGLETIKIIVQDNGKGVILPRPISKFITMGKLGIVGMQERARLLGGTLDIQSELGRGTTVSLEFENRRTISG